jgi:hypothetical protein
MWDRGARRYQGDAPRRPYKNRVKGCPTNMAAPRQYGRGLRPFALREPLSAAQGEGHGGDLQQDHQRGQDPSAQAEATELVDKAIQLVA